MDLSELVDLHRGGRSYVELARDCGGAPSAKRLQQLVRGTIKNFPDPETVVALAKGLRVTQSAVVLAAAKSLGLEVGTSMPRLVELLPARAGDLNEAQASAIAHLVMTIVDAAAASDEPPADWGTVSEIQERRARGNQGPTESIDEEAARDVGREGTVSRLRREQDQADDAPVDDPTDIEPR